MRQGSTRLLLALVAVLTTFSILVTWPSNPNRYLPDFVPWPVEECVGPVCIGKGIDVFGFERREMRLGLDLLGGTRLVLEADISSQPDIDLDQALNIAVEVVERRVNAFGVAESITERVGSNRIAVQLPGISSEEAVAKIGRTAQLQFMEMSVDENGDYLIRGEDGSITPVPASVVLTSGLLVQQAIFVPVTAVDEDGIEREINGSFLDRGEIFLNRDILGSPVLNFGMNSTGSQLLSQATLRLSNPPQPMAFFLDGEPILGEDGFILAPFVNGSIGDRGTITGLSANDAQTLSTLLTTGAFPVPLKVVQQKDVDATLGDKAVVNSVQAGLIGVLVVMGFMILYYRLPGLLAAASLAVYVLMAMTVYKLLPITITSAGMAAFVLSIGMAVDANILIFERLKEELRLGRSLTGAVDAGFRRAWTSIRDSNVATLITCAILYWFGDQFAASLVKGFALTLSLGVLVSMFSAITVTRTFLQALIGTSVMQHLWLFGSDVVDARAEPAGGLATEGDLQTRDATTEDAT